MKPETFEKIATWAGLVAGASGTVGTMVPMGKYSWIAGLVAALSTAVLGWAANKGTMPKPQ
jgi:hypothetical protein